jgi:hypothetical protein
MSVDRAQYLAMPAIVAAISCVAGAVVMRGAAQPAMFDIVIQLISTMASRPSLLDVSTGRAQP